jgi:hypothetical protein
MKKLPRVRPRHLVVPALVVALVLGLLGALIAPVLRQEVVVLGVVERSEVGEPGDRVDAVLRHDFDAHYFMRFRVVGVLKGQFEPKELGLRLHSPALTFWNLAAPGARYLLGFREAKTGQGARILVLEDKQRLF